MKNHFLIAMIAAICSWIMAFPIFAGDWLQDEAGIEAYLRVMDRGVTQEHPAIGRVIAKKRRCGLGTRVLRAGIEAARRQFGADKIYLEAQVYAKSLYEKPGLRQVSGEFLEDGIPHVKMILDCGA